MRMNRSLLAACAALAVCLLASGIRAYVAVNPQSSSASAHTPIYTGRALRIGVVGEPPLIRETNVRFQRVTFGELKSVETRNEWDAIFIAEDRLSEAAKPEYARVYQTAGIPFFFIQSTKSYLPFVDEDLAYEDVPDLKSGMYATGYVQAGGEARNWGYGLHNDQVNPANIKDVYSRIFGTIATLDAKA